MPKAARAASLKLRFVLFKLTGPVVATSIDALRGAARALTFAYAFGFLSADCKRPKLDFRLKGLSMLPTDFRLGFFRGGSGGGGEAVEVGQLLKVCKSVEDP